MQIDQVIVPNNGTNNSDRQVSASGEGARNYLRYMFGTFGERLETVAWGPFRDSSARLADAEIRVALRQLWGDQQVARDELVLEEVECWRGYTRADFLCVSGGALRVVEIKSDRDTLKRFDEQVRVYSAIADRVTLVVGWSLAVHAMHEAPWWWEVVLAERGENTGVRFVQLRDGSHNPEVALNALLAMLPVNDLRRLGRRYGIQARVAGQQLREFIAARVSGCEVRDAISAWLSALSAQRNSTR